MTWYYAKAKGAGAKPKRSYGYIEADSEAEAEERAEDLLAEQLFGVKWVKVTESEKQSESEIQKSINKSGGPNRGFRKDGSKIERNI